MHAVGKRLLNAFLEKHGYPPRLAPTTKVEKQVRGLDILVLVDGDIALLIEDKVHSGEHSNQLVRYKSVIGTQHCDRSLLPIYTKTGNQSSYFGVKEAGYVPFMRSDFLFALRPALRETHNAVVLDFLANLETHDAKVNLFLSAPFSKWKKEWFAWVGLYEWLQESVEDEDFYWDYVSNPRGGFLGAWWHFQDWREGCSIYLQIEQEKLCFKIGTEDHHSDEDRWRLRNAFEETLRHHPAAVKLGLEKSPGRRGKYMTVAYVDVDRWMARDVEDVLDKERTLDYLSQAAALIGMLASVSRDVSV